MRNTYLWLAQLVTGALIAVLLGIHMLVQHLNTVLGFLGLGSAVPTSWESMMARSGQGIWAAFYIALLAVGLYHGINGLRNIILEVTSSSRTSNVVNSILIVIGVVFFVGGTYVPLALLAG